MDVTRIEGGEEGRAESETQLGSWMRGWEGGGRDLKDMVICTVDFKD